MAKPIKPKTERKDPRADLAAELLERIKSGTATWQQPWEAGEVLEPINAITGKPYRGVNRLTLMTFSPDPSDPRWCTYKQAAEQGWQVKKGAHGFPVEKWTEYEHRRTAEEIAELKAAGAKDIEPTEKRLGVRYYTVFHASQIEGMPELDRGPARPTQGEPDPRIEKTAANMGVDVRHGGDRAFYRSTDDFIQLPRVEQFASARDHDTTLLHELSHATGHPSRLNRELGAGFGTPKYAVEELRAEMSAAMTAATLGIGFNPGTQDLETDREKGQTAAYLSSWLSALPEADRTKVLMHTIKEAQAISDYLIERTPEVHRQKALEVPQQGKAAVQREARTPTPTHRSRSKSKAGIEL